MFTPKVFLIISIFSVSLTIFYLCILLKSFLSEVFVFSNYVRDLRVDMFFEKAVIIAHNLAVEKNIPPHKMDGWTKDNTVAIVSDVMLQNGFNPKVFALHHMVAFYRIRLKLRYPSANDPKPS